MLSTCSALRSRAIPGRHTCSEPGSPRGAAAPVTTARFEQAEARFNLGVMYASGHGVVRNMAAAARCGGTKRRPTRASLQPSSNLARSTLPASGLEKTSSTPPNGFKRLRSRAYPRPSSIWVLHEHGRGVRQDARATMAWYRRAAEQGYQPAKERLQDLETNFPCASSNPGSKRWSPSRSRCFVEPGCDDAHSGDPRDNRNARDLYAGDQALEP